MKPRSVEAWAWVLIYAGLLLLCLGYFVGRTDPSLGWPLAGGGGAALVAGVALIVLRSRMGP